jgi:hypothetical protein
MTSTDSRRKYRADIDGLRAIAVLAVIGFHAFPDYDPATRLCAHGRCNVFEGGRLLYGDYNHLSIYGSEIIARDLIHSLRKYGECL